VLKTTSKHSINLRYPFRCHLLLSNYSQCSEVFEISALAFNLANYQVPLQLSRPTAEIVAKSSRLK